MPPGAVIRASVGWGLWGFGVPCGLGSKGEQARPAPGTRLVPGRSLSDGGTRGWGEGILGRVPGQDAGTCGRCG